MEGSLLFDVYYDFETFFVILYIAILLYVNLSYLFEYRKINKDLLEVTMEDIDLNLDHPIFILIVMIFEFFRSWLFYFIFYHYTKNPFIIVLLAIFILMDSYHILFNRTVQQLQKSKVHFYRSIMDLLSIISFIVYFFLYLL